MRPRHLALAALVALTAAGSAMADDLRVPIDQSTRIPLRGAAQDVFVGNPAIADVTVIDRRNLLITGKGFGTTNVVVVDPLGRTLLDRVIMVGASSSAVTVQRGTTASSYTCASGCQPMGGFGGSGGASTAASGGGGGIGGAVGNAVANKLVP